MAAPTTTTPVKQESTSDPDPWTHVIALSCQLTVDMPLPEFKVADMLRLKRGSVINSHWRLGADVPLRVNGEVIAHGEFEVVGTQLAVRLTELA